MARHVKNLRHAIRLTVDGSDYDLLGIGHLARAVGRSPSTVKRWQLLGLLPEAPYILNPAKSNIRRRWYLATYVDSLAQIMAMYYPKARLDRTCWTPFREQAHDAFARLVLPLVGDSVMPVEIVVTHTTDAGHTTHSKNQCTATCSPNATSLNHHDEMK
jgi:hypothetical protein